MSLEIARRARDYHERSKMKFHGILTIEDKDSSGETIKVAGVDLDRLRANPIVTLEFDLEAANVVGRVTTVLKVEDPATEPDEELRLLAAGKPFIKVEVEIPTLERTRARTLAQLLQPRPEGEGHPFFFGIGGDATERSARQDGKMSIGACVVKQVAIVQLGVHPAQRVIAGPLKTR